MPAKAFTRRPPTKNGRYIVRKVGAPQYEHVCRVTIYNDGSRDIHTHDGDTLDDVSDYEFKGPLPSAE